MRTGIFAALALATLLYGCEGGNSTEGAKGGPEAAKSGGAQPAAAQDAGEVLAVVNGIEIGSKEFEASAARKTPASGDTLSDAEKQEVLDRLVEEKLLYQAALKKGLDKDPKVQKVMVNSLLRDEVYNQVRNSDFSDEQLQKYYDEHKDEFIVPEKVQIKRILIKVTEERPDDKAKAEAERVRGEAAKKPDSFKDLAAKFSEDPYRRRGGDVGFVPRDGKPGLDPDVVNKAFEIKVDSISEVFKTSEGYNIIQVSNKRERVERTFQQMKGSVLRKVKNDKLKALYDKYVLDLRTAAKVEIKADKLAALEIKSVRRPMGPGFVTPELEDGADLAAPDVMGAVPPEGEPEGDVEGAGEGK